MESESTRRPVGPVGPVKETCREISYIDEQNIHPPHLSYADLVYFPVMEMQIEYSLACLGYITGISLGVIALLYSPEEYR